MLFILEVDRSSPRCDQRSSAVVPLLLVSAKLSSRLHVFVPSFCLISERFAIFMRLFLFLVYSLSMSAQLLSKEQKNFDFVVFGAGVMNGYLLSWGRCSEFA